ncbi:hypothetical protein LWM68_21710 [Niabella sp. W65]|nr:hypothetical protein [Niabella sp. W65]MCH7365147.1 hypothetical protein [Niabella sp. W65]ULT40964.1 hypothetical protein KRR40_40635 [Niabella sp. I65]
MDEQGNVHPCEGSNGYTVTYKGILNGTGRCFTGSWEIESPGNEAILSEGTWYLKLHH